MLLKRVFATILLIGAISSSAAASPITLLATDQGIVIRDRNLFTQVNITNDPDDTSVSVSAFFSGGLGGSIHDQYGYVLFDVSSLSGTVNSVVLHLNGTTNIIASGVFSVHDVTSAPAAFQTAYTSDTGPAAYALWTDLGDGSLYGTTTVPGGGGVSAISLILSQAAIDDLNAASGGTFAIGFTGGVGGLTGIPVDLDSFSLEVTTVPEPVSAGLLLIGLASLALHRRRA